MYLPYEKHDCMTAGPAMQKMLDKTMVSKFHFKARKTCFKRHFATSKTENWNTCTWTV